MEVVRQRVAAGLLVGCLVLGCALLAVGCAPGGDSEDEAAKSLVRKAIVMLDSVYLALGTYAIHEQYLSDVESELTFVPAAQHVVRVGEGPRLTGPGRAAEGKVSYFGDAQSYSVLTVAESGTLWGVFVDRALGGSRYFCSWRDGVLTESW